MDCPKVCRNWFRNVSKFCNWILKANRGNPMQTTTKKILWIRTNLLYWVYIQRFFLPLRKLNNEIWNIIWKFISRSNINYSLVSFAFCNLGELDPASYVFWIQSPSESFPYDTSTLWKKRASSVYQHRIQLTYKTAQMAVTRGLCFMWRC